MLISHKYKFIFVHIYKNAGTSITHALMPFGPNKIQVQVNRFFKKLNNPYLNSKFLLLDHHSKASEFIEKMGREKYESYFSFAIVRNPWDWQVSQYKYVLKTPSHHQYELVKRFDTFDKYIRWRCAEDVKLQKDFIFSENGELLVDFVGKFENLENDFKKICSEIGISASLPKLNISNTKPYKNYYNEETRELVRLTFESDISLFRYDF